MKTKLIYFLLISLSILILINFINISRYNFFTFYLLVILLPSILYSLMGVLLLEQVNKSNLLFLVLLDLIHLGVNWIFIHQLITEDVFAQLVSNTVKINTEIGNNVALDMKMSSFVMISLFVLILMVVEKYMLKKLKVKKDVFK